MSEKFNLKWNDFQSNVSQSFQEVRKAQSLLDVTLVSDDLMEIKAHRLMLTVCSDFFKTILKDSKPEPIIYLTGFHSSNISLILDYIYKGEVQIYQDQLDSFLECAQKLKIEGLLSEDDDNETQQNFEQMNEETNNEFFIAKEENFVEETTKDIFPINKRTYKKTYPVKTDVDTNMVDLREKRKELVVKDGDGVYTCIPCGKKGKDIGNMYKHVEIHIDGLQFNCQLCDKVFRSKNSFHFHKSQYHK